MSSWCRGNCGRGYWIIVHFSKLLYSFPFTSRVVHLEVRFHNLVACRAVRQCDNLFVFTQFDRNDVTQVRTGVFWKTNTNGQSGFTTTQNLRVLPREPAMKPRMRAFSGLVTLLAFLNISCASCICSRCKQKPTLKSHMEWEGRQTYR